ncbi:hypothetical protein FAZ15_20295 [Sphingobacterium olei]|uniref:Uncharacterized protein n=1 Tax=Sphingobacterium olei TaxID=2571155 RepID=A0A4U0NC14_9SPHI|nr:hypothetical protein [Sphingobacterium olei]TJZ51460.1 hypothetical protein FAZ15_20295 [Sphingobacterium olei]
MRNKNFIYSLMGIILGIGALSCGSNEEQQDPGPVTEMDKTRYNLNNSDELLYGTSDTLKQDSLAKDSLDKK